MFLNERRGRGSVGLGSIAAVAGIIVAWIIGFGVMFKSYQEGAASQLPPAASCAVVCQAPCDGEG